MALDGKSLTDTLSKPDLPSTDAVNGGKDTIPGGRKNKTPATETDPNSDTAVQDVLNEDPSKLTDAQKKAQGALAKAQGQVEGQQKEKKEGSLRIHIDLDIEVEIHLTARIKGDITIGLL